MLSAEIDLEKFTKRIQNVTSKGQKDALINPEQRELFRKHLKGVFERKYKALDLNSSDEKSLKMKFFFKKLRF